MRASVAHLWFESIHPFEDGNGHLGRAITEKLLALGLDAPAITALAEAIQRHRTDDYAQLQRASLSNQINEGAIVASTPCSDPVSVEGLMPSRALP
ncbi:hypothetical protein GO308_14275 [Sphingomonas sp. SFZ2018-12]|uniref:Fic family protein n=1 Tax=Sphingomonas sp. SFZ2018-12 TaxID=2683197 RepID=UPI001F1012C4|nr:Fic family protein [Sphingomonas sp. SFZ2018-12]MCH4894285.1 hypothetical protein [Sphingomonas sp. SFZ2018-12]